MQTTLFHNIASLVIGVFVIVCLVLSYFPKETDSNWLSFVAGSVMFTRYVYEQLPESNGRFDRISAKMCGFVGLILVFIGIVQLVFTKMP
jgi:hypothetical protein